MIGFENVLNNTECFLPLFKEKTIILRVYKSRRLLEVYSDDKILTVFKISLGRNPLGRKNIEGDGKTPEGSYYICTKNDKSKYRLFLGISYPGKEDAKRALLNGIISELTYYEIKDAIDIGMRPPWDTHLGGSIGIHGGGADSDWTEGCIAVDDADIIKLWNYVKIGTIIEIFK